jgi:hypothetical protein
MREELHQRVDKLKSKKDEAGGSGADGEPVDEEEFARDEEQQQQTLKEMQAKIGRLMMAVNRL